MDVGRGMTPAQASNETMMARVALAAHLTRSLLVAAVVLTGALGGGCLGRSQPDAVTEQIVLASGDLLALPRYESRAYWLLRSQPGWVGSHEVELGGGAADPAFASIRAARFRDVASATRAYAQLTPDYIYLLLRKRMASILYPFAYPQPLLGDEVAVMGYDVRLPPEAGNDARLVGQMTTIRAGAVVLLIESIGIPPEQFVPAITQLTSAAYRVSAGTK